MVPNGTCGKLKLYLKQANTSAKQGKKVAKGDRSRGKPRAELEIFSTPGQ
jgi:hypothetical protein